EWPKRPDKLSGQLRRLAPNLRRIGINVEVQHDGKARWINITKTEKSSVTSGRGVKDTRRVGGSERAGSVSEESSGVSDALGKADENSGQRALPNATNAPNAKKRITNHMALDDHECEPGCWG